MRGYVSSVNGIGARMYPANIRAVIDQVLSQEKENLLKLSSKWEDAGIYPLSDFVDAVIDEYLPDLRLQFYSRYSR